MDEDEKKQPPGHLTLMSITSAGYKHYLTYLKKGGTSGISDIFGSAAVLFGQTANEAPKPTPLPKDRRWELETGDEPARRELYLAQITFNQCRELVEGLLSRCRAGDFGEPAQKLAKGGVSDACVDKAAKELACISIFLMILDQGGPEPVADWLQAFLGRAFLNVDQICAEPPAGDLMDTLAGEPFDYNVCKVAARGARSVLGIDETTASFEAAVQEPLWQSGNLRRDLLISALKAPITVISKELKSAGL